MLSREAEYPDCLNCSHDMPCQHCFQRLFYHVVLKSYDDCFDSAFISIYEEIERESTPKSKRER